MLTVTNMATELQFEVVSEELKAIEIDTSRVYGHKLTKNGQIITL